jgi:hypothetical protein
MAEETLASLHGLSAGMLELPKGAPIDRPMRRGLARPIPHPVTAPELAFRSGKAI